MKPSLLVLSSFVVGLCMLLISGQFGGENPIARVLLGYSVSVFVFILLNSALDRRCSLLMVVFSFYHIGMFLVPGMLHSAQGWFPFFDTRYNSEDVTYVSLLLAIYSSSILVGYLAAGSRARINFRSSSYQSQKNGDLKIIVVSVLSVAISILCMAAIGLDQFVTRRGDLDLFGPELTPLSIILINVPRIASFCAAAIIVDRVISRRSFVMLILSIPVLLLALVVNNPLTIPRFYFFSLILVLAYASRRIMSPRSKLVFVGALLVGLVVVLPLANTLSRGEIGEKFEFDPALYLSTHGDFDGLQSVLSTYLLVQRNGLSYGGQLIGSLLTFVPREIWPTKPFATGQAAGEAMGFLFVNLSAPIPAEIYVDFGVFGLLLIPFGIGYAGRLIDQRAQRAILHGAPIAVRLLYGGIIGYSTIVSRGSLLAILSPIYLYFGFVAIWYQWRGLWPTKSRRNLLSEQPNWKSS